ncbi:hypothetical protein NPIL_528521 [Nephila pilipes]|uniref:Uncharacterized protein n=1 Tax=Nephila pilipes TaxID=299642 RepID=A0A8X6NVH3_NEPPI|nr:hypothetical protein NPIL_664011 [Nephila pilipes]GFT36608.1 hypothetical protein NPIL_528521 [Nephila pilipes]
MESKSPSSFPKIHNNNGQHCLELIKLTPRFNLTEDYVTIYLSLFERLAKKTNIDVKGWVSCLSTLLPSEIGQLIRRELKEKFED